MKNDWIQTVSGRVFRPLEPTPESISIHDIAHALSHACRFAGHVREFYSVAQHSVHVCREVHERCEREKTENTLAHELKFAALLHDASEAYLTDIPRPIKHLPELAGYRDIEKRVETAIEQRFGIRPEVANHPWIKWADLRVLATEARDLLATPDQKWSVREEPMARTLKPVSAKHARKAFMSAYALLQFGKQLCDDCGCEVEPIVQLHSQCAGCLQRESLEEFTRA